MGQKTVDQLDHLKYELILAQIVSIFKHDRDFDHIRHLVPSFPLRWEATSVKHKPDRLHCRLKNSALVRVDTIDFHTRIVGQLLRI